MSSDPSVRGIVVAHGGMAQGLVDAVRRIAGEAADVLVPLSNEGRGPAQLVEAVNSAAGSESAVVFVDLRRGSCGMAALTSCRDQPRRVVVSGVNLPMLLDFVFHDDLALDELVERVIERGRASIAQQLEKS